MAYIGYPQAAASTQPMAELKGVGIPRSPFGAHITLMNTTPKLAHCKTQAQLRLQDL